jgi:hypothetical protein
VTRTSPIANTECRGACRSSQPSVSRRPGASRAHFGCESRMFFLDTSRPRQWILAVGRGGAAARTGFCRKSASFAEISASSGTRRRPRLCSRRRSRRRDHRRASRLAAERCGDSSAPATASFRTISSCSASHSRLRTITAQRGPRSPMPARPSSSRAVERPRIPRSCKWNGPGATVRASSRTSVYPISR